MKDFKHWGIKMRNYPEFNYKAIWFNLKTIRLGSGQAKPLPPDKSEFYDVGLGTKCNLECEFCLDENTLVKTLSGDKKIKDIQEKDIVYTFNTETNKLDLEEVVDVSKRFYLGDIIEIETDFGIIRCTPNHKIYTTNRGYILAKDISIDDDLLIKL